MSKLRIRSSSLQPPLVRPGSARTLTAGAARAIAASAAAAASTASILFARNGKHSPNASGPAHASQIGGRCNGGCLLTASPASVSRRVSVRRACCAMLTVLQQQAPVTPQSAPHQLLLGAADARARAREGATRAHLDAALARCDELERQISVRQCMPAHQQGSAPSVGSAPSAAALPSQPARAYDIERIVSCCAVGSSSAGGRQTPPPAALDTLLVRSAGVTDTSKSPSRRLCEHARQTRAQACAAALASRLQRCRPTAQLAHGVPAPQRRPPSQAR